MSKQHDGFGGSWTEQKLGILEKYLDSYTTALKNQNFKLMYIDAFAGSGRVYLKQGAQDYKQAQDFIEGSVEIALKIANKPFDKLVFIEKDDKKCRELEKIRQNNKSREIEIHQRDANTFLREQKREDFQSWRGVLFIDPFATEVEWKTIEKIAQLEFLDIWILFPTSAISRLLPRSKRPEDVNKKWAKCLNRIFGNERWKALYQHNFDLFGDEFYTRDLGGVKIMKLYKAGLENLYGNRFLNDSRSLKNKKNVILFEFIFCVGSPSYKAISLAKRIAKDLLKI